MFLSSQERSPEVRSSLPSTVTYIYLWIILFDWDENVEHPFSLYQVALFSSYELKEAWINGDLELKSRQKKITFSSLPGKTFSLFAKVEKCKFLPYHCSWRTTNFFDAITTKEKVIKKLTGRQENINNFTTPPPLTIRNLKKKKNDSEV